MRWMFRSKIHNATVTQADLNYVGSITIDSELVEKCGMREGEKVLIVCRETAARLETYIILGEPGTGVICMNGPAARLVAPGDTVVIMGFELTDEKIKPTAVLVNKKNKFVNYIDTETPFTIIE